MISERMLKKWRKEALKAMHGEYPEDTAMVLSEEHYERILLMTQELLDQKLIEQKSEKEKVEKWRKITSQTKEKINDL